MDNNTILRSLRYSLNLNDQEMIDILALKENSVSVEDMKNMLLKDDQPDFLEADDGILLDFLDGLILKRRGPSDPSKTPPPELKVNNNLVLKKIRVALELKEEDMLQTIKNGGFDLSKSELGALFRKKGHKHYRACGDQLLRYFLKGLSIK